MKILHLSDLHLGKRVFECSMIEQQRVILSQALDMAKRADVTVIAGDIYDRQVPPAEAVALLSDFLTQMRRQGSPVLLISGNHDSAERIAFGSGLLDAGGVYVSPVYDGAPRRVDFEDEHGVVQFHLLPFISPYLLISFAFAAKFLYTGLTKSGSDRAKHMDAHYDKTARMLHGKHYELKSNLPLILFGGFLVVGMVLKILDVWMPGWFIAVFMVALVVSTAYSIGLHRQITAYIDEHIPQEDEPES